MNNLVVGKVAKFDYTRQICHFSPVTVDCGETIIFDAQEQVELKNILLIDKKIHNVYPDHKINEFRYGIGNSSGSCVEKISKNEQMLHVLAKTKLLDNFVPINWLYT